MSEKISEKGKKRGRLWSLYRRFLESDKGKAGRVLRHNLGFAKQRKRNQKYRVRCENEINRAFNELYKERRPGVIAYEDLAHLRGKAKSKGLSRKVSMWQRSIIKERMEYKNHVFGVTDPGPQNAAYSSQTCPDCGWVDERNREGDCFLCRKCGFTADADQVAARNMRGRLHDEGITKYTSYKKVKQILLTRYRLQNGFSRDKIFPETGAGRGRTGESADGTCCRLTKVAREAGFDEEVPSGTEPRLVAGAGVCGNRCSGWRNRRLPFWWEPLGAGTTPPFGSHEVRKESGGL